MKSYFLSLLSISVLTITGCGGGGNHTATPVRPISPDNQNHQEHQEAAPNFDASLVNKVQQFAIPDDRSLPNSLRINSMSFISNGKRFDSNERGFITIDYGQLSSGFSIHPTALHFKKNNGSQTLVKGQIRSYNQFYSYVGGMSTKKVYENNKLIKAPNERFSVGILAGTPTKQVNLPNSGKATYKGIAFNGLNEGSFVYHLDFGNKTGNGIVQGVESKDIILEQGKLGKSTLAKAAYEHLELNAPNAHTIFSGNVSSSSDSDSYAIGLFGPRAEEVAGIIVSSDGYRKIGLGGTRGAIQ